MQDQSRTFSQWDKNGGTALFLFSAEIFNPLVLVVQASQSKMAVGERDSPRVY